MVFGAASACNYSYQAAPNNHQQNHQVKHQHNAPPIAPNNNTTAPPVVQNNTTVIPPPVNITANNSTNPPVVNNSTVTPPPIVVNNSTVPPVTGTTVNNGQNLQTIINNAATGSNIIVNAGSYGSITITKDINLFANGLVKLTGLTISNTAALVQGFSISGDYAVTLTNTNGVQLLYNTITSNLDGISGINTNTNLLINGNNFIGTNPFIGNNLDLNGPITNALIENNNMTGAEYGLLFDSTTSANDIIKNNYIYGAYSQSNPYDSLVHTGTGIYFVVGAKNIQILNNIIVNSRDSIAVDNEFNPGGLISTGFTITGNTVTQSFDGIWATISNSLINNNNLSGETEGIDITGGGNTIQNNIVENNSIVGIALTTTKNTDINTLIGNLVSNNGVNTGGGNYYNSGPGKVIGE